MIKQKNKSIFFKPITLLVVFLMPIFTYAHNLNKSNELQLLVVADQRDRQKKCGSLADNQDWGRITQRDAERRKKVWEIFQKGRLKTSKDYLAAALIYQHGDRPAHYYQAYVWANKAVELGDNKGKDMRALSIDRYLISTGKKQLFGSQFLIKKTKHQEVCFCMQPVELKFPDKLRKVYSGYTLKQRHQINIEFLNIKKHCPELCNNNLKKPDQNIIPGVW